MDEVSRRGWIAVDRRMIKRMDLQSYGQRNGKAVLPRRTKRKERKKRDGDTFEFKKTGNFSIYV